MAIAALGRRQAASDGRRRRRTVVFAACVLAVAGSVAGDESDAIRTRARAMLGAIKSEVGRRYYAPDFRGKDFAGAFERAERRLAQVSSEGQANAILAQALLELDDSHTFYVPPPAPHEIAYGFELRTVGDRCRVVRVDAGSDAEAQGLTAGLAVLKIDDTAVDPRQWRVLEYALKTVRPRSQLRLLVQSGFGPARSMTVKARVTPRQKVVIDFFAWFEEVVWKSEKDRPVWRLRDIGNGVFAVKVMSFYPKQELFDDLMDKVHGAKGLIIDLRANPGGAVETLRSLLGAFFPAEVEIGMLRGRKDTKPLRTRKPPAKRLFEGPVVVLVDAASASASEILARVMQLEQRAKVLGDRSAGAVMVAEASNLSQGHIYNFLLYGVSVSTAELLMKDGASLENSGVTPDEIALPSEEDLREGRDPVLAKAAQRLGVELTPEQAGAAFR
jgi:C-terminal processing protease CtpA/Prc